MAKEIIRNADVTINGFAMGNLAREVTLEWTNNYVDTTGFQDTARTYVPDYPAWTMTVGFYDDYGASSWNAQMWTLSQSTTPVTIAVKKSSGSVSATNPLYSGSVLIENVPLMTAQAGQVAGGSITLRGNGTLTRATS